ncbi:MAG: hypothetical protein PHY43_13790 [Verrucomicrobiales bacterium]|nr:hypothetical protein [Verrucomicrobiales bacterium]
MTPLQQAQQEWVVNTTPHCKDHFYDNGKWQGTDQFRKFGQAIALINWHGDDIEITKMEKVPGASRRAADSLVNFLKELSRKYHFRISCQVRYYTPDKPLPDGPLIMEQEKLEAWYEKHGFKLFTRGKPASTYAWYPDVPSIYTDDDSGCLPAN